MEQFAEAGIHVKEGSAAGVVLLFEMDTGMRRYDKVERKLLKNKSMKGD